MTACTCPPPAEGGFWSNLFSTDFVPRAQCVGDRGEIIWLHVASDAAIAISYYSIPLALAFFVKRRKDLAFSWMFLLYAGFILACGTTHLFNIIAFWFPMYRADGLIKAATGGISLATAALMWPLVPKALAMPSPGQLRLLNEQLSQEVRIRRDAEDQLAQANESLELRVADRTTELASTNKELSARAAEIESLYKGAPTGLCLVDSDLRIHRVNAQFTSMVDIDRDRLIGAPLDSACAPLAQYMRQEARLTTEPDIKGLVVVPSRANPGRVQQWHVAAHPVVTESGARMGVSIAVQDMTEQFKLEEQLRQSQKMEAVGQLASGIAHDINNTLTAIYGYLSLARVSLPEDHVSAPYLEKIAIAAEQAGQITKSLLTFARPAPPMREPMELAPVLQHGISMVRGLVSARIILDADLREGEGLWVQADPTQIQQVILNLAINARDAMPEGGRLSIRVARAGDAARIQVSDTGVGMTPEVMARVFDPFFTTKPRGQGTGLGLAVVQGIVRAHNGTVTIESIPNQGTTVTFELPTIIAPGQRDTADLAPKPTPGEGLIILVEDNRFVRELLATGLRSAGFTVVEAADSAQFEAAASAHAGQAKAYVLDIDIPGKSGTECLAALRATGDHTPAVFVSGGKASDVVPDRRTTILAKPFHASDLVRALNAVIRSNGHS